MNQQNKINLDPSTLENIACDECGGIYFQEAVVLKRIPGILIAQSNDQIHPLPILLCGQCGKPMVPGAPKEEPAPPTPNGLYLV